MTQYSPFIEEIPVDQRLLNSKGQETLSKERPCYPIQFGIKRPESMRDIIRRMIAAERERANVGEDVETFEDADDFEVGDDYYDHDSRSTPYEQIFEPPVEPATPVAEPVSTPEKADE